jgi:hypothetical protein
MLRSLKVIFLIKKLEKRIENVQVHYRSAARARHRAVGLPHRPRARYRVRIAKPFAFEAEVVEAEVKAERTAGTGFAR